MGDELTDFARWLRETSARAGYDPDERGGTAKLARASGIDAGQLSRFFNGKAAPSAQNMVHLATAIRVGISEMAHRVTGTFEESPGATSELSSEQWVTRIGLKDPADQSLILAMVDRMKALQEGRESVKQASLRASDLASRLASEDIHSGEIPAVLEGLHRLVEDLDPDVD